MNSIVVWVMMAYSSHGGQWVPTIEFKDQQKCQVAANIIYDEATTRKTWGVSPVRAFCVRIEK
jgi:hypothetical protein